MSYIGHMISYVGCVIHVYVLLRTYYVAHPTYCTTYMSYVQHTYVVHQTFYIIRPMLTQKYVINPTYSVVHPTYCPIPRTLHTYMSDISTYTSLQWSQ